MFFLKKIFATIVVSTSLILSASAMQMPCTPLRIHPATQAPKTFTCNTFYSQSTNYQEVLCNAIYSENLDKLHDTLNAIFTRLDENMLTALLSYGHDIDASGAFFRAKANKMSNPCIHIMLCSYIMQHALMSRDEKVVKIIAAEILYDMDNIESPISSDAFKILDIENILNLSIQFSCAKIKIFGMALYIAILINDSDQNSDCVEKILDTMKTLLPLKEWIALITQANGNNAAFESSPKYKKTGLMITNSLLTICVEALKEAIHAKDQKQEQEIINAMATITKNANAQWTCSDVETLRVHDQIKSIIKDLSNPLRKELKATLQKKYPNIYQ